MPAAPSESRPCADQPDVIWRMEQLDPSSPVRQSAVFVVHGMGAHQSGATAVSLRYGFEDAVTELRRVPSVSADIQGTYILEGYWGDFPEVARSFSGAWESFSEGEKNFFARLWKSRSVSAVRAAAWFGRQALRLPRQVLHFKSDVPGQVGWPYRLSRCLMYLLVVLLTWLSLALLLLTRRGRSVLANVLGDVRMYLQPRGAVEKAIVQNIDRHVTQRFLRLLGLDWDFQPLSWNDKLRVGGRPREFERVTWVAHSLGTVVSYNALSALFERCRTFREQADREGDAGLRAAVERVEKGLHRFITIGSPLQKIAVLFRASLQPWPRAFVEAFLRRKFPPPEQKNWWVNFYDILDPVSGVLRQTDFFFAAKTEHTPSRLPIPGWAHIHYWRTLFIAKYILSETHSLVPGVSLDACPRRLFSMAWRHLLMIASLLLALIAAVLALGALLWRLAAPLKWLVTFR